MSSAIKIHTLLGYGGHQLSYCSLQEISALPGIARTPVTRLELAIDLVARPARFGAQYSKVRDNCVLGRLHDAESSCLRDKQGVADNGVDNEHNRSFGVRRRYSFYSVAGPYLGRN